MAASVDPSSRFTISTWVRVSENNLKQRLNQADKEILAKINANQNFLKELERLKKRAKRDVIARAAPDLFGDKTVEIKKNYVIFPVPAACSISKYVCGLRMVKATLYTWSFITEMNN